MAVTFTTEVTVAGTHYKGRIKLDGAAYAFFRDATKVDTLDQTELETQQAELLDIVNKVAELNSTLPPAEVPAT